jgi:nitrous oxidase accessory protein
VHAVARVLFFSLVWALSLPLTARPVSPDEGPLQAIIDAAEPGAELVLAPGVYRGGLVISQPLTLRGQPGAVIDALGSGDVIRVKSADVRIQGLTLRNSGFDLTAMNAGINAERGADNIHIEGNVFENVAFGVWLWHLRGPRVLDNRIRGNAQVRSQDRGDAIRLFNIDDGEIAGNEVHEARDGVYVDTSRNLEFRGNRIHDSRFGIHYMYSHDGRLIDNYTTGTRAGYALMMSRNLQVHGNRSERDQNYGILMNFITYSSIAANRISGVTAWHGPGGGEHGVTLGAEGKAMFIYNSQFNEIRDNVVSDSELGVHLTAGSEGNKLHGNSFIGNQTQVRYVATRTQEWSHEGRGNYWSDYLGWDLSGDGIGDVPYEPNDAVDRLLWQYPLAKVLMNSPAVQVLRWAQRQFPVLRPQGVRDSAPLMAAPASQEFRS